MRNDAPGNGDAILGREHADGSPIALGTWIDLTIAMPARLTNATRDRVEIAGEADAVATALREASPECAMESTRAYALGLATRIDAEHQRKREEDPAGPPIQVRVGIEPLNDGKRNASGKTGGPRGDEGAAV